MDITKFNKELKAKVTLAKNHEKRNEIDAAIKLWVEISEMTLKFSKSRNLDSTFKNMLITRTKGILQHIKNLKAGKVEEELFEEEIYIEEDEAQESEPTDIIGKDKGDIQEKGATESTPEESVESKDINIIEKSEFKNLPKGFKEIQPSEDFKIITPHNEEYVTKRLSQTKEPTHELESKKDEKDSKSPGGRENVVCFACGYDKNPKNAKICEGCG
ncbi:MAG: hypothetical protein ACFFCI_23560, partial [Promethearchaeota archaeon]